MKYNAPDRSMVSLADETSTGHEQDKDPEPTM